MHLRAFAIAHAAGVDLTLEDFSDFQSVPHLADLKPSGNISQDLYNVGGVPAVMKYLLKNGFLRQRSHHMYW